MRSRITLDNCYPKNTQNLDRAKKATWERKLAKNVEDMGASDSVFDWETGRWSFTVDHFSRYGLNVDDDDEDMEEVEESDEAFNDSRVWMPAQGFPTAPPPPPYLQSIQSGLLFRCLTIW